MVLESCPGIGICGRTFTLKAGKCEPRSTKRVDSMVRRTVTIIELAVKAGAGEK
jgi:hypothetical protein